MNKRKALPEDIDQFFQGKSIFFGERSPAAPAEAASPPPTAPLPATPFTPTAPAQPEPIGGSALPPAPAGLVAHLLSPPQPTAPRPDIPSPPSPQQATSMPPAALPVAHQATPASQPTGDETIQRTNGRTVERTKVRHTFDIYQDQLARLRKIQLKREEVVGKRYRLGDLVQEALDQFITQEHNQA